MLKKYLFALFLFTCVCVQAEDVLPPEVNASKIMVVNQLNGEVILAKGVGHKAPIASITKLMMAMVVLDAKQRYSQKIKVTKADYNRRSTYSKLKAGAILTRIDLLKLALIYSDNRAAYALSRNYPGGRKSFVHAMNVKAQELGMVDTRFVEPSGLSPKNVSTVKDLVLLTHHAHQYPLIRKLTTSAKQSAVDLSNQGKELVFSNTNALVRSGEFKIGLSKTGYIRDAGRCLVMQTEVHNLPFIIVILDSIASKTRILDARNIKKWLEKHLEAYII